MATVIPPTTTHSSTVVFLHGLGGSGMDECKSCFSYRRSNVPAFCPTNCTLVSTREVHYPNCVSDGHPSYNLFNSPMRKVTYSGLTINSWYDIKGMGPEFDEDDIGVKASAKTIQ